jgi:hypothetical protein
MSDICKVARHKNIHQTYFYNPLVPASTPEYLVHSLGSQGGLDQVADGHGTNKAGQASSLKEREKQQILAQQVAKKVFPVLGIRIRIRMFLDLPDPDPCVADPDLGSKTHIFES